MQPQASSGHLTVLGAADLAVLPNLALLWVRIAAGWSDSWCMFHTYTWPCVLPQAMTLQRALRAIRMNHTLASSSLYSCKDTRCVGATRRCISTAACVQGTIPHRSGDGTLQLVLLQGYALLRSYSTGIHQHCSMHRGVLAKWVLASSSLHSCSISTQ